MAKRPDEIAEGLSKRIGTTLDDHTTRRSFVSKAAKVATVVASGGLFGLMKAQPALATCEVNPGTCAGIITCECFCADACPNFGTSVFCCSIPGGKNNCPVGTYRSGWWKCTSTTCAGGWRYFIDCNPLPGSGQCPCVCPNGCNGHPSCAFCRDYFNCNAQLSLGRVKCRVAKCKNPGNLYGDCSNTGGTETNPILCQCNATCAC